VASEEEGDGELASSTSEPLELSNQVINGI